MRAAVSIGIHGRTPAATVRALAPRIERLGFRALWVNDVPGGDSLEGLRVAAEVTSGLRLATGVIPLDRRPAASLDMGGVPAERLTLGLGAGRAAKPLGLVRDAVDVLRERTSAELVVGALGPKMRRLAAERADGVLLNWLTPDAAAEADAELHSASGSRDTRSILYLRTITDGAAHPALEGEAEGYEAVAAYAANFERLGIRAIEATLDLSTSASARLAPFDVVDEVVLRAITPTGALDELERFAEAAAVAVAARG